MFSSRLALSLPQVVTFGNGNTINYMYSADGTKLRTTHVVNGTTTTTDYCGNVIYENGTAKRLLTDEGYVDLTNNTYYYYLKDHQGNNRAVVNSSGTVQETNHYYPFGGLFATNGSVQDYKYNGKELDTKKGLNLYDYGARHYDAALGRWHVVDPLAEKYYSISSYGYCSNSPLIHIDPTGMDEWEINSYGQVVKYIKTDKHDAFFFVDEEGNRIDGSSLKFRYGTVENYNKETFSKRDSKGNLIGGEFDTYTIRGDNKATELFEALAFFTQLTDVEWGHIKTGIEGENGLNFITTSHLIRKEAGFAILGERLINDGYTIRAMNHSHPYSPKASLADEQNKIKIIDYFVKSGIKVPEFSIFYVPNFEYIPY